MNGSGSLATRHFQPHDSHFMLYLNPAHPLISSSLSILLILFFPLYLPPNTFHSLLLLVCPFPPPLPPICHRSSRNFFIQLDEDSHVLPLLAFSPQQPFLKRTRWSLALRLPGPYNRFLRALLLSSHQYTSTHEVDLNTLTLF